MIKAITVHHFPFAVETEAPTQHKLLTPALGRPVVLLHHGHSPSWIMPLGLKSKIQAEPN